MQLRGFSVPRDWAAYTREHILVREKALYSAKRVLRSAGLGSLSVCVCVCVCADTRVRGFSVLREWCVYTCVCTNTHTHTHTHALHTQTRIHTHTTRITRTHTHTPRLLALRQKNKNSAPCGCTVSRRVVGTKNKKREKKSSKVALNTEKKKCKQNVPGRGCTVQRNGVAGDVRAERKGLGQARYFEHRSGVSLYDAKGHRCVACSYQLAHRQRVRIETLSSRSASQLLRVLLPLFFLCSSHHLAPPVCA